MTRSGAAAASLPVCKYFEVMQFLHEKTANLPTHSNVDISPASCTQVTETGISEDQLDGLSPSDSFSSASPFQAATGCSMSPLSVLGSAVTPSPPISERPSIEDNAPKRCKRKATPEQSGHDPFLQQIQQMDDRMMKIVDKETQGDEATVFCMSLIPVLKDFNKKQLRLTKIKIQQLLYDIEFGNE